MLAPTSPELLSSRGRFRAFKERVHTALNAVRLLLTLTAVGTPVYAHPAFELRLAELERAIAAEPENLEHYRQRGDLCVEHGDFGAARSDYQRAAELGWGSVELALALGDLEFRAARFEEAIRHIDRAIAMGPSEPATLRARARALAQLGRDSEAMSDLDRAFELGSRRTPALWVEWARVAARAGQADRAVPGLDRAIAEFGSLTSLERAAFELERSGGDTAAALARAERAIDTSPRPALWAVLRAELLDEVGRDSEATIAYQSALGLIEEREARRPSNVVNNLRNRAEAGLARTRAQQR